VNYAIALLNLKFNEAEAFRRGTMNYYFSRNKLHLAENANLFIAVQQGYCQYGNLLVGKTIMPSVVEIDKKNEEQLSMYKKLNLFYTDDVLRFGFDEKIFAYDLASNFIEFKKSVPMSDLEELFENKKSLSSRILILDKKPRITDYLKKLK
jgi:hypothetical protein